jgi:hypothetical protein
VKDTNYEAPHYAVFFFPVMSNYFPQHPLLKDPQFIFFPNVRDEVSHPYKTAGKIIVLSILIFKLLREEMEDIRF